MSNFNNKPLTLTQAADFTGYSKAYLYKLIHLKKIPCFKPGGGKVLFNVDDLTAFCFRRRQAADYELHAKADAFIAGGKA